MGFFGHVVVSQSDVSGLWDHTEPEAGPWTPGLRGLRVRERLGADWEPIQDFMTRLAENARGGFLGASIWDSDGALLVVGVPGQPVGRYWLQIDGVVGIFVLQAAPFDDDGNPLSQEEEAAQEAQWRVEADAYREQMLSLALSTEDAARLCLGWAHQSNLVPGTVDDVTTALTSTNSFVEDSFAQLLHALGARKE